jgi:hypothetical protein
MYFAIISQHQLNWLFSPRAYAQIHKGSEPFLLETEKKLHLFAGLPLYSVFFVHPPSWRRKNLLFYLRHHPMAL